MGFLSLIPADKLAALYDTQSRQLKLYAKGNAPEHTGGIFFYRVPDFAGGLKFELMGWVDPIGKGKQPYTKTQAFSIQLPSPVINSKSVIIVDENHPKGVPVEIHYTGFGVPPAETEGINELTAMPADETPPTVLPDSETIRVLYKEPFQVKQAIPNLQHGGSVGIRFDPSFLVLVDSSLQGNEMVWTLNSLRTGSSQIVVTIYGGIANFVIYRTYNVEIFVLENPKSESDTTA